MKSISYLAALGLLAVVLPFVFASCGDDNGEQPDPYNGVDEALFLKNHVGYTDASGNTLTGGFKVINNSSITTNDKGFVTKVGHKMGAFTFQRDGDFKNPSGDLIHFEYLPSGLLKSARYTVSPTMANLQTITDFLYSYRTVSGRTLLATAEATRRDVDGKVQRKETFNAQYSTSGGNVRMVSANYTVQNASGLVAIYKYTFEFDSKSSANDILYYFPNCNGFDPFEQGIIQPLGLLGSGTQLPSKMHQEYSFNGVNTTQDYTFTYDMYTGTPLVYTIYRATGSSSTSKETCATFYYSGI